MCLKQRITRSAFERSSARRQKETRSILMRSAEFWLVQHCFVAKGMSCLISLMSVGYVNTLNCLINVHIFDYPDSQLSGLFTLVPPSLDNRGSTADIKTYAWKIPAAPPALPAPPCIIFVILIKYKRTILKKNLNLCYYY